MLLFTNHTNLRLLHKIIKVINYKIKSNDNKIPLLMVALQKLGTSPNTDHEKKNK